MNPVITAARKLQRRKHVAHRSTSRRLLVERLEIRSLLAALPTELTFVPGEILIGLEADLPALYQKEGAAKALQSAAARLEDFGLSRGEVLLDIKGGAKGLGRLITRWELAPESDISAVSAALAKFPGVAYAEPNYVWSTAAIPNDTSFSSLWGMHNT